MEIMQGLQNKNNQEAYQLLLLLEERSAESDELYGCFEDFLGLLKNRSSFVQVRGFRLACAQARWDRDGKLARHLDVLLAMLDKAKPTAVRQCLSALKDAVEHRPELREEIRAKLETLDLTRFGDSMRPLIERDISALRLHCV